MAMQLGVPHGFPMRLSTSQSQPLRVPRNIGVVTPYYVRRHHPEELSLWSAGQGLLLADQAGQLVKLPRLLLLIAGVNGDGCRLVSATAPGLTVNRPLWRSFAQTGHVLLVPDQIGAHRPDSGVVHTPTALNAPGPAGRGDHSRLRAGVVESVRP
jgi:hypothetical protein